MSSPGLVIAAGAPVPCSARLSCEFNEERAPHFNEEPHADNLDWLDNPTQKFVMRPAADAPSACCLEKKEDFNGDSWPALHFPNQHSHREESVQSADRTRSAYCPRYCVSAESRLYDCCAA